MVPLPQQLSHELREIIWYHLDNSLLDNALFYAGRLQGVDSRSPDNIHALALCYLRSGQFKAAVDCSRQAALKSGHLGCSYVFAQACLQLTQYIDGVSALERARSLWELQSGPDNSSVISRRFIPDAAAVNCLLGKLHHGKGDLKRAVSCYVEALKQNPFMWDAFERLCDTGANVRPTSIFKITPQLKRSIGSDAPSHDISQQLQSHATSTEPLQSHKLNASNNHLSTANDPFQSTGGGSFEVFSSAKEDHFSKTSLNLRMPDASRNGIAIKGHNNTPPPYATPNDEIEAVPAPPRPNSGLSSGPMEPPNAPLRKARIHNSALDVIPNADAANLRNISSKIQPYPSSVQDDRNDTARAPLFSAQHNKRTLSGMNPSNTPQEATDPSLAPQRRSVRLFKKTPLAGGLNSTNDSHDLKKLKPTGTKGRSEGNGGRLTSDHRRLLSKTDNSSKDSWAQSLPSERLSTNESNCLEGRVRNLESIRWLLELLSKIGDGYFALTRYQCHRSLECFASIPIQQRETPWLLAQIGKTHFELGDHVEARSHFQRIRKKAPFRVQDMELYSTVLWHLKHDTELAFLAHELVEIDRYSPETWCIIGNLFSLQRDHDQALKCFKRATQLDPTFAYGFTLQGHEHIANEEYDKALTAYRKAVGADNRHYNGWYGLGKVYEKLGKHDVAEKHYFFASNINPNNAILSTYIGTVLDKQGKQQAALSQYMRACELAPESAMARFKKARALLRLRRLPEAHEEFTVLKDLAPDEANVHFMLGKVCKLMRDKPSAIRHYLTALNLDPKASPVIKEAMESLDYDEDVEADDEVIGH